MPQEKLELKTEGKEKLRKYIYTDHSGAEDKIVFECVATGIYEADKMYEEKTGKDPRKQNYVGCEIKDTESL